MLQMAALDAFVEVSALTFLTDHAPRQLPGTFPGLMGSSQPPNALRPTPSTSEESAQGELEDLLWVAMRRCEGRPVGRTPTLGVAAQIGRTMAALHGIPLPQTPDGRPATFFKDEDAWREAAEGVGGAWQGGGGAWEPFLRFLGRKAREVHAEMFAAAELPRHLLQMLKEYLPAVRPPTLCNVARAQKEASCSDWKEMKMTSITAPRC